MEIIEIFYSVQGEGKGIGLPTTFIRTSGCNLRCEWCDTAYAWGEGKKMDMPEVMNRIDEYPSHRYCITGGEPLLQEDLIELIEILLERNKDISVETNGSIDISHLLKKDIMISMDYKLPSSGMMEHMLPGNLALLRKDDQLKFVVADKEDYSSAKYVLDKYELKCNIVFQPMGGVELKELAEMVLDDGIDVRVLPQLHKMIWGEKRGV